MVLVIGYIIIATIVLWHFLKVETPTALKVIIVPLVIGYGLVLLYTVPMLLGWPLKAATLPDDSRVVKAIVREPSNIPGYIYFWVTSGRQDPRAFKLDYTRELHERLAKVRQQASKGGRITVKKKGKGKKKLGAGKGQDEDTVKFRILFPRQIMQKDKVK